MNNRCFFLCSILAVCRPFRTLYLKVPAKTLQAHCLELKCHFRLSICVVVSEKSYLLYRGNNFYQGDIEEGDS